MVLAATAVATQKVMVDVTVWTAMGDREYAGTPRDGFRQEPGWRGVAGSSAARAEAGKHEKYGDMVRAAGAGRFEGACVEDFGAFGKGALDVLQWIAEVAFGEPGQEAERNLFKWKAAQHIGVYVARSVVEAHDENARRMRDLAPEVLLARYGRGGPSAELLEEARRGVADPARAGLTPVPRVPRPHSLHPVATLPRAGGDLASFAGVHHAQIVDPTTCPPGHLTIV